MSAELSEKPTNLRDTAARATVSPETGREVLESAVRVSQQLDFQPLLQALAEEVAKRTGAEATLALGPAEDAGKLAVLGTSLPATDPRHAAIGHLDASLVRERIGNDPRSHAGLGPLGELVADWPGARPGSCWTIPVTDAKEVTHARLVILFPGESHAGSVDDAFRLLEATRPAVTNAVQVRAMRELIIKDDTAHCFNRRYFEEFLPEELSRASRFRAPLSLIFLDMDNLKAVNNKHGHSTGSKTLTEVSARIRRKIRKFDKLFRFGGDEFCILLPETEWHGAMEVAERVRDAISGQLFLAGELGGDALSMTASLGVATYPLHARTQAELIREADKAMQRVKRNGKNSIGVAELAEGDDES